MAARSTVIRPLDWRQAAELVNDVLRLTVPYIESLDNPTAPSTRRAAKFESTALAAITKINAALGPLRRMYDFESERRKVAHHLRALRETYQARLGELESVGQPRLGDRAYRRELRLWCEEFDFSFGESIETLELTDGEILYAEKENQRRANRGLEPLRGAKTRGTSRAAAHAYRELHKHLGIRCPGVRTLGGIMADHEMDRLNDTPFGIEGRKGAEVAMEFLLRVFGVDDEELIGMVTDAVIFAQDPENDEPV